MNHSDETAFGICGEIQRMAVIDGCLNAWYVDTRMRIESSYKAPNTGEQKRAEVIGLASNIAALTAIVLHDTGEVFVSAAMNKRTAFSCQRLSFRRCAVSFSACHPDRNGCRLPEHERPMLPRKCKIHAPGHHVCAASHDLALLCVC